MQSSKKLKGTQLPSQIAQQLEDQRYQQLPLVFATGKPAALPLEKKLSALPACANLCGKEPYDSQA